ncbi:unnamed protein product [Kuraishia capsulata CBS 1993]|uniref:Uncharacterized protein n=1 Tax=Kuraishia capsulata CBS 1993 TaxID=1382522 RepID=W6MKC5_9ASCO|nr:uncharacterized protein KUCA_T00002420001 [Kuraishia capsulata CBS 1993]CDK26448.1 unnamed protein product [Kuraishia capsulata CBS 1993]
MIVLADTWITCGRCASLMGNFEQSIKCFDLALHHQPNNFMALIGLLSGLKNLDIVQNTMENTTKAIDLISRFVSQFPELSEFPSIWKESAECFDRLNMLEQTSVSLGNAINLDPNNPDLWLLSSKNMVKTGNLTGAAQILQQTMMGLPSMNLGSKLTWELTQKCHLQFANIALLQQDLAKTAQELELALSFPNFEISQKDEYAKIWHTLIVSHIHLENPDQAWFTLARAETLIGKHYQLEILKAFRCVFERNFTAAVEILMGYTMIGHQRSNEKEEEEEDGYDEDEDQETAEQLFLVNFLMGFVLFNLNKPQESFVHVSRLLEKSRDYPLCWLLMGNLYLSLSQLEDAITVFNRLVKLQGDDVWTKSCVAKAWEGLLSIYERCDRAEDVANSCMRCYQLYSELGHHALAKFYFDRLAELATGSKLRPLDMPVLSANLLMNLLVLRPLELNTCTPLDIPPSTPPLQPQQMLSTVTSPIHQNNGGVSTPTQMPLGPVGVVPAPIPTQIQPLQVQQIQHNVSRTNSITPSIEPSPYQVYSTPMTNSYSPHIVNLPIMFNDKMMTPPPQFGAFTIKG